MDPESDLEQRLRRLEAEAAHIRRDIGEALVAQNQLHDQLKITVEKLDQLIQKRNVPNTPQASADPGGNYGLQIGRLESRMRSVEQKVERVGGQVGGILESRIWRTLVRGGSFFLRVFGTRR